MRFQMFREELKKSVSGRLVFDALLSEYTSWKIGGPAEVLFFPSSVEDLARGLAVASREKVPVTILGNGTNVLVSDRGIPGLTIKLKELRHVEVSGRRITAQAGMSLPELSRIAQKHGLSGLEFGIGIPASLGGAVTGNAGAHGRSMQDVIYLVRAMDEKGQLRTFYRSELDFGYRSSIFRTVKHIVVEVVMELENAPEREIRDRMQRYLEIRKETQPTDCATAGSVFKNPPSGAAGYYIEKAGLKGFREGGAEVSVKHANFFVNIDNATADDIKRLIDRVREEVLSQYGIQLETEIKMLGEDPGSPG